MLLAIDIGNTSICFGVFEGRRILKKFSMPTSGYAFKRLKNTLSVSSVDAAVISSVAPQAESLLAADLKRKKGLPVYIIGKDLKVPLKNLYRNPSKVGSDRLVNAYAGIKFYGAPLVVVDFGTAVTLDAVSRDNAYLGGMILPGLELSLQALSQKTALLPSIKLNRPKEFIGRDTANSMLSGIFYGYAAAVDCLSYGIKKRVGKDALVIGTGGNISSIAKYCKAFNRLDQDLTLKGINLIFRDRIYGKK